jgi:hypothetical protein
MKQDGRGAPGVKDPRKGNRKSQSPPKNHPWRNTGGAFYSKRNKEKFFEKSNIPPITKGDN